MSVINEEHSRNTLPLRWRPLEAACIEVGKQTDEAARHAGHHQCPMTPSSPHMQVYFLKSERYQVASDLTENAIIFCTPDSLSGLGSMILSSLEFISSWRLPPPVTRVIVCTWRYFEPRCSLGVSPYVCIGYCMLEASPEVPCARLLKRGRRHGSDAAMIPTLSSTLSNEKDESVSSKKSVGNVIHTWSKWSSLLRSKDYQCCCCNSV